MHGQLMNPGILYGTKDLREIAKLVDEGLLAEGRLRLQRSLSIAQTSAAKDEAHMLQSLILRQSQDYRYADKLLGEFIQQRPNSPFIPIAWLERGFIAYHIT